MEAPVELFVPQYNLDGTHVFIIVTCSLTLTYINNTCPLTATAHGKIANIRQDWSRIPEDHWRLSMECGQCPQFALWEGCHDDTFIFESAHRREGVMGTPSNINVWRGWDGEERVYFFFLASLMINHIWFTSPHPHIVLGLRGECPHTPG